MNDFQLFTNGDASLSDMEANVGFTMAYLAHELTPIQNLAFEKRFAADAEFRDIAQPIMDAWTLPRSLGNPVATNRLPTRWAHRRKSLARIAAVIAIIALPMVTFSQAIAYAAAHPTAPGHAIAKQIVQTFSSERETAPVVTVDIAAAKKTVVAAPHAAIDSIPRTRKIGARVAISADSFTLMGLDPIRVLSDGRVFVTDRVGKFVRFYDATLTRAMDVPVPANRWAGPVTVSGFRGDSTLLISNAATVFVDVLDPMGRLARTIVWRNGTLRMPMSTGQAILANSGFVIGSMPRGLSVFPSGSWGYKMVTAYGTAKVIDSSLVIRSALGSLNFDTVAYAERIIEPTLPTKTWTDSNGTRYSASPFLPWFESDAVVPMMDGTIAIIRSADYHIDWIDSGGSKRSTAPTPHVWRSLTEPDAAVITNDAQAIATRFMTAGQYNENGARVFRIATPPVQTPTLPAREPAFITALFPMKYRPMADAEGRLWIPQRPALGSGATPAVVFDIVNRAGQLVDRVEMPPTIVPVGFAPGLVYAMQWIGTPAGCPHPEPGVGAPAAAECVHNLGRLTAFRMR